MRNFTIFATEDDRQNLSVLADPNTTPEPYRSALLRLGESLGLTLAAQFKEETPKRICIACTVEDADSLAQGIVNTLSSKGMGGLLRLVCFWNDRIEINGQSIAPILKEYREPCDKEGVALVVVKSIISSACVVRTNLSNLIADSSPKRIFIVAPVMFKGADQNLAREFPEAISKQFEFITLAIDDEKKDGKWVVPGVGGNIYDRLGYGGFQNKNLHIPILVKSRRNNPLLFA